MPNGGIEAKQIMMYFIQLQFSLNLRIVAIIIYAVNNKPCIIPIYRTKMGKSKAYFIGMAKKKSNIAEIPSIKARFLKFLTEIMNVILKLRMNCSRNSIAKKRNLLLSRN